MANARVWIGMLLGAALLVTTLVTLQRPNPNPHAASAAPSSSSQVPATAALVGTQPPKESSPQLGLALPQDSRAVAAVGAISLDVELSTSIDGEPFEVTLNVLDNDVVGYFPDRVQTEQLFLLADRTTRLVAAAVRTNSPGPHVKLPVPVTAVGAEACVWITHPLTEPRVVVATVEDGSVFVAVPPQACELAWITVRGVAGEPVPGASVRQQGLPADAFDPYRATAVERARRALIRDGITDAQGRVPRIPMGGPSLVEVRHAESVVRQRLTRAHTDVEIELGDHFILEGRVTSNGPLGQWAMATVLNVEQGRRDVVLAATSLAAEDGRFGPFEVPLGVGAGEYSVRLAHGEFVPKVVAIDSPGARGRVWLDVEVEAGVPLWLQVTDAATGQPIDGAVAEWTWADGGREKALTGPEGYAQFTALPRSTARARITARGFAPYLGAEMDLSSLEPGEALGCALDPEGRIEGKVDFEDEPAQSFTLAYGAPNGTPLDELPRVPAEREGHFVVEGLDAGIYTVQALLEDGRPTRTTNARVDSGSTTALTLTLQPTFRVVGRVIDFSTGLAIDGVHVALVVRDGDGRSIATLDDVKTDVRGRFQFPHAALAGVGLHVFTPGYGTLVSRIPLPDAHTGEADVGDVALDPLRSRTVRLIGATDPREYRVQRYASPDERVPFNGAGAAQLPPGNPLAPLVLVHADGTEDLFYPPEGQIGANEAVVTVDPRARTLQFDWPQLQRSKPSGTIQFLWRDPLGNHVHRTIACDFEDRQVPGINSESAHVHAVSYGQDRASRVHDLSEEGPIVLTFGNDATVVRVLERSLQPPTSAVAVGELIENGQIAARERCPTDADGRAEIAIFSRGKMLFGAELPDGRWVFPRECPVVDGEVQIFVDPPRSLHARLRGPGGEPLRGARWSLSPTIAVNEFRVGTTDLLGEAILDGLQFEHAHFEARPAGYWPVSTLIAQGPGDRIDVTAYPPGGLAIEVVRLTGEPVVGAGVALRHLEVRQFHRLLGELGGNVARWMEAGLLPARALQTDGLGRFAIEGVPVGEYAVAVTIGAQVVDGVWSASAPLGAPLRVVVE